MLNYKFKNKVTWQSLYAFAIVFLLAFYLLRIIIPQRWEDLYAAYMIVVVGILAGIYFSHKGLSGPLELKVYFLFFVWTLFSRWLNKDIYLFIDHDLVITVLISFLVLVTPVLLQNREREIFIDVITLLYGGFFVLAAFAGVFIFITNTYIHVPPENVWITIKIESLSLYSINLLSSHRLLSAGRLFLVFFLLLYQFINKRNKILKVLIAISLMLIYMTIAICHSRTTSLALSVSVAMFAMACVMPRIKNFSFIKRSVAAAVLALVALFVCFFGFDLSNKAMTKLNNTVAPAFAEVYNNSENTFNEEYFGIQLKKANREEKSNNYLTDLRLKVNDGENNIETRALKTRVTAEDKRSIFGNRTLTGRTSIWHAGITTLIRNPSKVLTGFSSKNMMDNVNSVLFELYPNFSQREAHMHNSFMQVLMLMGIPGLVLVLAWSAMMVRKMLIMFFSCKKEIGLTQKIPIIAISGFFVICMMENFIFISQDTCAIIFMLLSGIFLADYKESF